MKIKRGSKRKKSKVKPPLKAKHKSNHHSRKQTKKHSHIKPKLIPLFNQESSRKYLHDLKQSKKPSNLSENKELEFMIKSIKFNNPGITPRIVDAFRMIDRKNFVKHNPYEDMPIHIAHGQTISQPTTIARILRLLDLNPGQNVLEIGTNTGYHASLTAWLVSPGNVTTIEIFPDLAHNARINLKKLVIGLEQKKIKKEVHVQVFTGDALKPYQEIWQKKYDRIYYTGGLSIDKIGLVKYLANKTLKENGLLLFPSNEKVDYGGLELWQKQKNRVVLIKREPGYSFVPIVRQKDIEDIYQKLNK